MRPVNSNQFASLGGSFLEQRRKEKGALEPKAHWAKSIGRHGNGGMETLPMLATPLSPLLHWGDELLWVSLPLKTTFTSSPNSLFFFFFFLGKGMKQCGKPIGKGTWGKACSHESLNVVVRKHMGQETVTHCDCAPHSPTLMFHFFPSLPMPGSMWNKFRKFHGDSWEFDFGQRISAL